MEKITCVLLFYLLSQNIFVTGRRYSPQQNSDFLQHEAVGYNDNNGKKDIINQQSNFENKDYASQFPALGPTRKEQRVSQATSNTQDSNPKPISGGRDYVNPNYSPPKPNEGNKQNSQQSNPGKNDNAEKFPALGPPKHEQSSTLVTNSPQDNKSTLKPSGQRDYVNPNYPPLRPNPVQGKDKNIGNHQNNPGKTDYAAQFPALGPQTTPKTTSNQNSKSSGNRDYVNPNYQPAKPQPGKVKDLINFYDDKSKDKTSPSTKAPSYSSTLTGPQKNNAQTPGSKLPAKTPSFSSIVSGSTKPGTLSTPLPNAKPGTNVSPPAVLPVLPSSIVNNNKNNKDSSSNSVTDSELQTISEELLKKDANNAAKYVTVNYQEKTTSSSKEDKAPQPLLSIGAQVWNMPTVQKFVPLLDNYERDTLVNEYVTPQERNEENAFMDAIMSTTVIRYLMGILKDKGYVTPDPKQQRDFLKQLWFGLYSRGKGKISSSGFEHVFVSELKNNGVSGLHNWIYFSKEETANRINYLGYLKYSQLKDKGAVLKLHFNQQGVDKPVDTMFIGTSPELEMALYTLCFVTRADNSCNLKLAGEDVNIVTHTFRYRSKNLIGSAYPEI